MFRDYLVMIGLCKNLEKTEKNIYRTSLNEIKQIEQKRQKEENFCKNFWKLLNNSKNERISSSPVLETLLFLYTADITQTKESSYIIDRIFCKR